MLLIDAGNSRVKCRLIEGEESTDRQFRLDTESQQGINDFALYLASLNTDSIYLASVASDQVTQRVTQYVKQNQPRASFTRLFTLQRLGKIQNAYHDHTQLGVDRWLTLLAASDLEQQDVIIIDAGSAITIDLLSQNSGHLGGAILAGLRTDDTRFREIFARLDFAHADIRKTDRPGRSTLECIHLTEGLDIIGYTAGLVERWSSLLQQPVVLLLCGQDAPHFMSKLAQHKRFVPDLVFKGMLKQIELQG